MPPYLFDEKGYGFNHINVIVDDYDEAIEQFAKYGLEPGMTMISSDMPIAYIDAMDVLGHNIEIHGPSSSATSLCRAAKANWDGKETWMDIREVMAAMKH